MNTNPSRRGGAYKAARAGKHAMDRKHAGAAASAGADGYRRDAAKYHEGIHASAHVRPARKPSDRKRAVLAAACCVALLTLCVSGVYAWFAQQDARTNAFVKGETTPVINEDFPQDGTVKKNVFVSIEDNCIDVWVRAQISVQWQVEDGKGNTSILWDEPVPGEDYAVVRGDALDEDGVPNQNGAPAGWVEGADGFYYWTVPLVAKDQATNKTGNLVESIEVLKKYDDGRRLVVDVAAQSLSASANAFNDVWATSGFVAVDAAGDVPAHLTVKSAAVQDAGEGEGNEAV